MTEADRTAALQLAQDLIESAELVRDIRQLAARRGTSVHVAELDAIDTEVNAALEWVADLTGTDMRLLTVGGVAQ